MILHKFKFGDAVIIVTVLIVAALSCLGAWLPREGGKAVEVKCSDGGVSSYRLDRDGEYVIVSGDYTLVLAVSNGSAYVSRSDCCCGICTAHAPISRAGESIVCLPAGVSIRVTGTSEVDGEAG